MALAEYGLLGKKLEHSFSKSYFEKKFASLGLKDHQYNNFEIESIDRLKSLIEDHKHLKGFNVTIPYKENIIPMLDVLDEEAKLIGAVNCVKMVNGKLLGFNTDVYGFASSIKPFLEPHHNKALILGTGGGAKAVAFALKKIGVEVYYVSNSKTGPGIFTYKDLNEYIFNAFNLIINTTPLGMFPNIDSYPDIPYHYLSSKHLCYDLIYNPETTVFLKNAREKGATIINGLNMLKLQAEKSWEIWNS